MNAPEIKNTKELWQAVLSEIELQISKPNFLTWLKNSELVEKNEKEGVILVSLPNNFTKEWVKNRYHKLILGSLRNLDSSIKNVEYVVASQLMEKAKTGKPKRAASLTEVGPELPLTKNLTDPKTNLNPKYTFDCFVVGSSNELAFAAVQAVIKDVGTKYNPLFIYGGVGLGKTHLLQAAGNEIMRKSKNRANVLYITSEKFIRDVVWSIRNKRTEDMKKKYRDVDVLVIDDIQFIGGKNATEMEFFYTFNALYESNKQLIMSSDRPPAAIPTLEERLRSRFEGGMIADIGYPDYETRLAILKMKAKSINWSADHKTLEAIATKVRKNVRELEGVFNKVVLWEQHRGEKITARKVDEIIDEVTQVTPKKITPNDVIKVVADFFDVPQSGLATRSRRQEVALPRQITMYLLRDVLKLSYPHIGEKLGKRDHTTAIHAFEKISREILRDPSLNQKILLIKERVYNK